jgi:RNA-binding protein 8A
MPQGYVLIEFPTLEEAKAAVEGVNGTKLLDQTISVDFAFVRPPPTKASNNQSRGGPARGGKSRNRSRSPGARRDDEDEDIE